MNEKNNFALVPKPPSAVEKVEPGAKRVLSGMVADTLALAKAQPDRPVSLLLGVDIHGEDIVQLLILAGMVEFVFPKGKRYDLKFIRFDKASELLHLTQRQSFNAIVIWFDNINWNTSTNGHYEDNILKAIEVLTLLKTQCHKPIIVAAYRSEQPSNLPGRLNRTGIDAFFWMPFENGEQAFVETLDACLKSSE